MERPGFDKSALYVGDGVTVDGAITSDGVIEVLGVVTGEISASEVRIAPGGRVEGSIRASRLDVSGYASNSISVTERLSVRSSGCIHGDVTYGSIQIDAGASIVGTIRKKDASAQITKNPDPASVTAFVVEAAETEPGKVE